MTLEEWIDYAEERAKEHKRRAKTCTDDKTWVKFQKGWAKDYQQLAKWLREIQLYKENKHSCECCKYKKQSEHQIPCNICKHNHNDMFEWEGNDEDNPEMKCIED